MNAILSITIIGDYKNSLCVIELQKTDKTNKQTKNKRNHVYTHKYYIPGSTLIAMDETVSLSIVIKFINLCFPYIWLFFRSIEFGRQHKHIEYTVMK